MQIAHTVPLVRLCPLPEVLHKSQDSRFVSNTKFPSMTHLFLLIKTEITSGTLHESANFVP
jgi:hypothetical protein